MDERLTELMGNRVTDDWWERAMYSRDLGEVPDMLKLSLNFKTVPDLVARPKNTQEVVFLVSYAKEKGLVITPRGGGSSGFYNSVPVNKGISLDLCGLNHVGDVDEERETVAVGAGCRWQVLENTLRRRGWAVKSYPSSAPIATVGGWLNMEGYGIGSLSFGRLFRHIVNMEVVLASGEVVEVGQDTNPPVGWFAGSDGTLGIVTKVTLSIRRAPKMEEHWVLSFDEPALLAEAAAVIAAQANTPYNLSYSHRSFFDLTRKLGHQPPEGDILAIDYDGDEAMMEFADNMVNTVASAFGATILAKEVAAAEWKERFRHMSIKRLGPSILAAEDYLPLNKLGQYHQGLTKLESLLKTKFYSYGMIVSSEKVIIFTGYLADHRKKFTYMIAMSVTYRLHKLAKKLGGHPMGVGLWNTPYLSSIYPAEMLSELRDRKKALDVNNLLNPGKHYDWPAPLSPISFSLSSNIASLLHRFTGSRDEG